MVPKILLKTALAYCRRFSFYTGYYFFHRKITLIEINLKMLLLLSYQNIFMTNVVLSILLGLGKTIQSLTFLDGIFKYGIRGPFLVIAPLSTIPNWQREFELWSDMNVIVYHGSQTSRNMLAEYEMYYKDDKGDRIPDVFKFHVLITTYECLITDILELREIHWRACVIGKSNF